MSKYQTFLLEGVSRVAQENELSLMRNREGKICASSMYACFFFNLLPQLQQCIAPPHLPNSAFLNVPSDLNLRMQSSFS